MQQLTLSDSDEEQQLCFTIHMPKFDCQVVYLPWRFLLRLERFWTSYTTFGRLASISPSSIRSVRYAIISLYPWDNHQNKTFISSVGSLVVGSLSDFYRLLWQIKLLIRYPRCEGRLTFYSEPYGLTISAKSKFLCSMAIAKLGQRIPLAHRFARMLEDLIITGKDYGAALQYPSWLRFSTTWPQVQSYSLLG